MVAVGIVLIVVGAGVALFNWGTVLASAAFRTYFPSIPLVGAVLLGVGAALVPQWQPYAWRCLLYDFGTLEFLLQIPVDLCKSRRPP